MTLPDERTRAVMSLKAAVFGILEHLPRREAKFAKVPVEKIAALTRALRHYPMAYDIARSHEKLPDVWGPVE